MKRVLAVAGVVALLAAGSVRGDDLRPFVRGSWKQIRQAHQGQPVVVHFWGVTCAPCMGELPKWGDLQKQRQGAGVVFVAADPEPIAKTDIASAIARTGIAGAENWMFADSFLERLRFEVNPTWGGELPYTVTIGVDGQITSTAGVADLANVKAWLGRQEARARARKP